MSRRVSPKPLKTPLHALVVAGGMGKRMGGKIPKQFLVLAGKIVLSWSLECFDSCPSVTSLTLVLPAEWIDEGRMRLADWKPRLPLRIVPGGEERQDSVFNGLSALPDEDGWVAVHDGARPAIKAEMVEDAFRFAVGRGNAVCAVPASDTLVLGESGRITGDLDRSKVHAIQTPQIFPVSVLKKAILSARETGFTGTDDSGLVRRLGCEVFLFPGSRKNLKLTLPEDIPLLEAALG